ncbi:hypothetical protein P154DRAFT_436913, partial [Amniculicola lignicola CBS 123094]
VQCTITHSEISEDNTYTCLSYVWGNPNDEGGPFPILMNDKTFMVGNNLHGFLEVASKKYSQEDLWVDATCIA